MTKGPKVTLQVVCDGCEHLADGKWNHSALSELWVSHCLCLHEKDKPVKMFERTEFDQIQTPDWCPYRAGAVKAVAVKAVKETME